MINKKNKNHFDHYLKTLESYGYENHYEVLNSKEFGIPQSTNRVFVVSIRKDLKQTFKFENLVKKELPLLKEFLDEEVSKDYFITQKSMIKAVEQGKIKIIDNIVQTITTKQWRWNNSGVVKIPLTTFNAENYINDLSHPVQTITAGGANSRIKIVVPIKDKPIADLPVFIIDDKPYHLRILTERECWRLMGWKDEDIDRVINMPKTHLYHMAGNAIVVQVLESIFKELLKGIM